MIKKLLGEVIFQDQDLVVMSKAPGVVVNNADSVKGPTLQTWFWQELAGPVLAKSEWQQLVPTDFDPTFGQPEDIFQDRQGMVHRLDKETSGLVIFARNPGALVNLLDQFKTRQVSKEYLCLTHGFFELLEGQISAPLARSNRNRHKFCVDPQGRAAQTDYRVEQTFSDFNFQAWEESFQTQSEFDLSEVRKMKKKLDLYRGFSLVRCWPKTGRTHQIRVHMAFVHHPLVADKTYLGKKRFQLDRLWCPRHFLHAATLQIKHPRTQKLLKFSSALPQDLAEALNWLKTVKNVEPQ